MHISQVEVFVLQVMQLATEQSEQVKAVALYPYPGMQVLHPVEVHVAHPNLQAIHVLLLR